jgi:hypothetical protein
LQRRRKAVSDFEGPHRELPQMSNPQPPYGQQPPHGQPHPGTPPHGQPQGQPYPGTPPQGQPFPGTPPQGQPQGQPFPGTPPHGQSQGQPFPGTPPQGQPYGAPQQGQPYGGPPPQGQPYGGQPQGEQPYGQQGQPFPAAAPEGAPQKKSNIKVRAIAVIVALLVVGGVGFYFFNVSPASAEAGDCIKVNKAEENDADVEKIDCTGPEAVFKVGKKLDSASANCPDGDYVSYMQSGSGTDFTLCLVYNVAKGDCLSQPDAPDKARKVACGGSDVEVEILDVMAGKTDPNECQGVEGATAAMGYSEPAMIICAKSV